MGGRPDTTTVGSNGTTEVPGSNVGAVKGESIAGGVVSIGGEAGILDAADAELTRAADDGDDTGGGAAAADAPCEVEVEVIGSR